MADDPLPADLFERICCVCQEQFSSLTSTDFHDLLRPDACPLHILHRECLLTALAHRRECPVCQTRCTHVLSGDGQRSLVNDLLGTPPDNGEDAEPVTPEQFMANHFLVTLLLLSAPSSRQLEPPSGEQPASTQEVIDALMMPAADVFVSMMLAAHMANMQNQPHQAAVESEPCCGVCGTSGWAPDRPPFRALPCDHVLHELCALVRLRSNGGRCPTTGCAQPVAALINLSDQTVPFHQATLLAADPRYSGLGAAVGLSCDPGPRPPFVCPLCAEARPGEARAVPCGCPPAHMVHAVCLEERAGRDPIRQCPVEGCGRTFASVTRISPA